MITQMTQHSDRAADRIIGVRSALQARGLELRHEHLIEMPHKIIEGQMAMRALMQGPVRPTAVRTTCTMRRTCKVVATPTSVASSVTRFNRCSSMPSTIATLTFEVLGHVAPERNPHRRRSQSSGL